MTAEPTASRSRWPLASRLVAAFIGVAVLAVATLTALTLLAARDQVSTLLEQQRLATVDAVTAALAATYERTGSWRTADLQPAVALAAAAPATLQVLGPQGEVSTPRVEMANMMTRMHGTPSGALGPPRRAPVTVDGRTVATAVLRFPTDPLPGPEQQLRAALGRTVLTGAALAATLAAAVAVLVARRITQPIAALVAAVGAFEHGDPAARARLGTHIAELERLAGGFNRMAATIARREQQRRALAADIAHELRTPITTLQASLEAMVDGVEPPTTDRLGSLHDDALRLSRLVEDLETLSAAEASEFTLQRRPVDLASVAADAVAALTPQLEAAELKVLTDLRPCQVRGDAVRLRQVATNLLTNAAKFTAPGGSVTVSVAADDTSAELRVADTGHGIPADDLPHIFERFWRGHTDAATSGSGIGLAVVAELVRAHDGQVHVDSQPGRGTTVTARLPQADGQPDGSPD